MPPVGRTEMSFIHYELVGHFDPCDPIVFGIPSHPKSQRSIDTDSVNRVLKSLPHSIDHIVTVTEEGYVYCQWSADIDGVVDLFLKRLADETGAVVMSQMFEIWYPDAAKAQYDANLDELGRRWKEYRSERWPEISAQEREPSGPPIFNPPEQGPCPYCGEPLRTSIAKQCRFCKMDWHDPTNVYCRM